MQTNLSSKIITKSGQTNLSGDSDISKNAKHIKGNEGIRKLKPSLIPRRKINTRKVSTEKPVSLPKNLTRKPYIGHENVQRVQHLNINQDLHPGIHSVPKSVTTARPIPTLQHIYREGLSNETFTDWLLESVREYRDIPEQFVDLNTASVETPKTEADSIIAINFGENSELNPLNNLPDIFNSIPAVTYRSTNENVQDWLSSKLDYPTRDNESGYQTMSKPSQNNFSSKSKNCCSPKIFGDDKFYIFQSTLESNLQSAAHKEANSDENLMEQPTVAINKLKKDSLKVHNVFSTIPKLNTDIKLVQKRTDTYKPIKYPSSPNPQRKLERKENHPINSYVDYPSEVLQKTTNFDANCCETKNNGLGVNSVLRDDLSSQCTLDLGNEYDITTENDSDWAKLQSSRDNTTIGKSSKTSTVDEPWQLSFCDDKIDINCFKNPDKNSYHDYYYHYCWRKEVAKKNKAIQELWDGKGRCKKCQKVRHSPHRKKLPRSLKNLKKRMSIGRICRRRWDCVWKKTAERWTSWSKSPYKFRKFQIINFKKPIKWDDADAQTTIFVYNETGTDAVTGKRKSSNVTDALNSSSQCGIGSLVPSAKSNVSHLRHANIGPSIFRFHTNPSIFIGKSPNQSKMTSYKALHCRCDSVDGTAKSVFSPCEISSRKITDHTQDKTKAFENKMTSAMFQVNSVKLDETRTVKQDTYTQMVVTCYNAETTTKFTPSIDRGFIKVQTSDDLGFSFPVDEGTQSLISNNKSQRSINVMTSKVKWRELMNKETQASPVSSIRKVSTGFVVQDRILQDAKSSVVTDTSIPYRKLKATITTPKGTILSCTGTKITSVSSVQIQTASVISKPTKITTDIAVSTDVNAENRDCLTAPSLYLRHLEDVSLGTDSSHVNKSEKSTSYAQFTDYISAGISTSNLVNRVSFNGGAHLTQGSFGAAFHPEYSSICTNTDIETKPQSTKTGSSFGLQYEQKHTLNRNDCYAQYSISKKSNELSNNSDNSARIGHSRLLSVRNLGGSPLCETPQAQTTCSSFDKTMKTTQEQSVSAEQFKSIDEPCVRRTSNVVQTTLDTGEKDEIKQFLKDLSSTSKSKQDTPKIEQNLVISSNLNAAKWIKGCVNESRKDVQSIVNLSESTVTESSERASFAIVSSRDKKVRNEMKNLSKVPLNQQRAINCGEVITNDITECIQVRPEVRDTATNYDQEKNCKSDFMITSHCLLSDVFTYYDRNKERNDKVAALLNKMTSHMTSCTLCAHAECCLRYNQRGIDTSIQAVTELLTCPNYSLKIADTLDDQDVIDDIKSHLASNCRYYRNMLAMKLALFKENFQQHITPSGEQTVYHTTTIPNIFTEACTMKPSGRKDVNCQTKTSKTTTKVNNNHSPSIYSSPLLSPAYSFIDIRRNQEKDDLKAVYDILTAIEGRVRRIKNNLRT